MTASATSTVSRKLNHYKDMRSIPAILSVAFVAASLYQFGGINEVMLTWVEYTLTQEHAALGSVTIYAVAFMSSETSDFAYYDLWEKVLIIGSPVLIIGQQYVAEVDSFLVSIGDPLGYQLAFLVTLFGWGVAVGK